MLAHDSSHGRRDSYAEAAPKERDELSDGAIERATPRVRIQEFLALWNGLHPSLILCTHPAIHFTVYDYLRHTLRNRSGRASLSVLEAFALGLIAKLVSTVLTYPLIRAKVILMVAERRSSLLLCLQRELKSGGLRALFTGCDLQLLHSLLKSALLMAVKERITRTTRHFLLKDES